MTNGIILLDETYPIIQSPNFEKNCPIQSVNDFMNQNNIEIAVLNPYQITTYYTRPFALYFDLRKNKRTYDYLIINLHQAFHKFTETYPEYWCVIKDSFETVHFIK